MIEIQDIAKQLNLLNRRLNKKESLFWQYNFSTNTPTQEVLSNYALSQIKILSPNAEKVIPTGTIIKNSYDDCCWVYNRVINEGLSIALWQNVGEINLGLANNDGNYGVITGSRDYLKGFVDINGEITINGLQEELQAINAKLDQLLKI